MALQNITPVDAGIADLIVRSDAPWIETHPGQAWLKLLWTGAESGRWAVIFRWKKGCIPLAHKHLADSHTFVLKGSLQVRDGTLRAGDYVYEPNGVVHEATTTLEDTEYLFICNGPLVFFDEHGLTRYLGWEEIVRLAGSVQVEPRARAA